MLFGNVQREREKIAVQREEEREREREREEEEREKLAAIGDAAVCARALRRLLIM